MFFTEKQLRIMKFIQRFRGERGISPTMEEIAGEVGVTKITIYDHLKQLERKGALKREKFRARSIEPLVWVGEPGDRLVLPFLGPLGTAIPLDGGKVEGTLDLKDLLSSGDGCFAIQVHGDAFLDAQVRDGDYILIRRKPEPAPGDVVVVQVAGAPVAIRRYFRERGKVVLQPLDPKKKATSARGRDVRVLGIMEGLLRGFGATGRN